MGLLILFKFCSEATTGFGYRSRREKGKGGVGGVIGCLPAAGLRLYVMGGSCVRVWWLVVGCVLLVDGSGSSVVVPRYLDYLDFGIRVSVGVGLSVLFGVADVVVSFECVPDFEFVGHVLYLVFGFEWFY